MAAHMIYYPIEPMAKPRQTQKDKFNPSERVLRYRSWADEVRLRGVTFEPGSSIWFGIPVPRSLTDKEKQRRVYTPHLLTPDLDNLAKGLMDAVYPTSDSAIWRLTLLKLWTWEGCILIDEPVLPTIPASIIIKLEEQKNSG